MQRKYPTPETIAAVIQADIAGTPKPAMKPLYVARNTWGVDLDAPIYRILEVDYFLQDINSRVLTHSRISEQTWFDPLNPLLNVEFPDPVTGGTGTLKGVVRDMFGSCWSLTPLDTREAWAIFSHGAPSVRIESTPRRLISSVMQDENPHYEIHHVIGKVEYLPAAEIKATYSDPNYEKHLDGLGAGIFASLTALQGGLKREDEVRLICNFMPNEPWPATNFKLDGNLLKVPFEWRDTIRDVVAGPFVLAGGQKEIEEKLKALNITCPVRSSARRTHLG
jgi:hypothetical protein